MKRLIFIIFVLAFFFTANAAKWQVISVNYGKVYIGNRVLKKGEKIDSKSHLKWEDTGQILKVVNLKDYKVLLVAAQTMTAAKLNSIEDLLVQKNILAAREGILMTAHDVENYFNRRLILLNSICVETGFILDDNHCFFLQYVHEGDTINKRLPATSSHGFCINDDIFIVDGQPLPPTTLQGRLYYYDKENSQTMLFADNMEINVEPRQACCQLLLTCWKGQLDAKETASIIIDYCQMVFPMMKVIYEDIDCFVTSKFANHPKGTD